MKENSLNAFLFLGFHLKHYCCWVGLLAILSVGVAGAGVPQSGCGMLSVLAHSESASCTAHPRAHG